MELSKNLTNSLKETKNSNNQTVKSSESNSQKPGFLDDIEKKDIKIRQIRNQLNRVKSATIKECLYTNKNIPDIWKNQLGYQNNILKIFSQDKDFLSYCGKGPTIIKTENDFDDNMTISKTSDFFYKKSQTLANTDRKAMNSFQSITSKYYDKKNIVLPEDIQKDEVKGIINIVQYKYLSSSKSRKEYSDREILNILENYRNAYPITERVSVLDLEKQKESELLYSENGGNNIIENLIKGYNAFENVYKLKKNDRIDAFRQSIYNKIIPPNVRAQSSKVRSTSKKKLEKFEESKFGPFLNSNSEAFNKRIEINNPIIKKYLESINYFGPYFSYCPPCRNRNMEFYNKMNHNEAIKLMQYLKKVKGKDNIITSSKKNVNTFRGNKNVNYQNTSHTNKSISFHSKDNYSGSVDSKNLQKNLLKF